MPEVEPVRDINILLQEIAEKLKSQDVNDSMQELLDEIEFLNWVRYQEDMYAAYSYSEE